MNIPKDIQELVETLQLAGWSQIDEDNLIYEIFCAQDYPDHDSGNYETSNKLFDSILSDLDVQDETNGEEFGKGYGYGIIRVKEFYYKASWGISYNDELDISKIKENIVRVEPVNKTITVYEEV